MVYVKKLTDFEEINAPTPFQTTWYQKTFTKHFCRPEDLILLEIFDDKEMIGHGGFEKVGNEVFFLGMKKVLRQEEVTDYGDIFIINSKLEIIDEAWTKILQWFSENNLKHIILDYVREDSPSLRFFKSKNIKMTQAAIAPYIDLPRSWDEYLASLDRVDRKELKRKIRRLDVTKNLYVCNNQIKNEDFEEFVRLLRVSSEDKKKFMSEEIKNFFWDLISVDKPRWETNLCFLKIDGKNTAGLLTFENKSQIFGYNSGFDPSYSYYSVGLLLHAYKIRRAIEKRKRKYDFMRGTERYKYDLGGKNLRLLKMEINL